MKKRITANTCGHDFKINQIVKVDEIDSDGDYRSNDSYFDNDDCEDFDDYKPGDKVRVAKDTLNHKQTDELVTIKYLTEGFCADGSRSYMTSKVKFIPERDFDCYEGETYVNKQEETKTMKYKVGDKVKIVARKRGHCFEIGSVVSVVKIYQAGCKNENYDATDGEQTWSVGKDEISPVTPPLITRPRDYTGCDPEIAEALKQGLDVYCEVWDDYEEYNKKDWVYGYVFGFEFPYITKETYYLHARPIRQEPAQESKTKLVPKPASEIFTWLENPENGYKQTVDGKFWEKENEPTFTDGMTKYCGRDSLAGYAWHPAWLREVPVTEPESISEVSETSQQMYKVGDVVEVTEESWVHEFKLGDTVEIIKDDRVGTYKCKRLSDGIVQWLTPEYFKPVAKPQTATTIHKSTYHLHPGERVTVIKTNEAGNLFCESESGVRIWMQPYQLKFD